MNYVVRLAVSGEVDLVVEAESFEEAMEEAYAVAPVVYLEQLEDVETEVLAVDEYDDETYGFDLDDEDDDLTDD